MLRGIETYYGLGDEVSRRRHWVNSVKGLAERHPGFRFGGKVA